MQKTRDNNEKIILAYIGTQLPNSCFINHNLFNGRPPYSDKTFKNILQFYAFLWRIFAVFFARIKDLQGKTDYLCAMSPLQKTPFPEKLRVLVVDDSPAQRSLICRHLHEFGFEYVEADSGKAALHITNTQAIDVILSDWMMPQMSGLDLCEKIRKAQKASSKASPYVYFILLTVKSETLDIAKGLGAGADDFLIKPIAKIELNARLRAAARLLQMHTELQEKQTQTAQAFERLNCAYQVIETDLKEAGQLHRAMMPPSRAEYKNATVHTAFKSSQHLGGDVLGYFCIDETALGFMAWMSAGMACRRLCWGCGWARILTPIIRRGISRLMPMVRAIVCVTQPRWRIC